MTRQIDICSDDDGVSINISHRKKIRITITNTNEHFEQFYVKCIVQISYFESSKDDKNVLAYKI